MALKVSRNKVKIPVELGEEYTIRFFRRGVFEDEFKEYVIRSDDKLYIEGELSEEDISEWVKIDGYVIFQEVAGEVEELIIFHELIDKDTIKKWYEDRTYFYDEIENYNYIPPISVDMEVI